MAFFMGSGGMAIQDIILLPGYKQSDRIVLTNIGDGRRKWVFAQIEDDNFHWQDVITKENGEGQVDQV